MRDLKKITSLVLKDAVKNKDLKKSHLQNILKASAIINSKLDIHHVLKQVIHFALKLTNSVAASIILLSDTEDELVIAHSTDLKTNFKFPMKKSIAGLCISTGQIKVVNDTKRNPLHFKKIDESTGFKTNCLLCVPLKIKGKTSGCIMLINKRDKTDFNDDDITVAAIMSNFAAVSLRNAEIHEDLQSANLALKAQLPSEDNVIGENREVRTIFKSIKKLKNTSSTVLILGESGTGKGVLARAIHEQSNRREHPFITVNCAIYSRSLLESELFGHEKGAFTGADKLKKGRFELARGGTIFLDEIGEMEMPLQTKLLRVLQEKEFERVGGTETLISDVRIIAATNTNLENALDQNLFRKDLYYRLKVMVFHMPPLRSRKEDMPSFVKFFLEKYRNELNKPVKEFDNDSMNALLSYDYPGNIRELENIVERAVVLAEDDAIHIHDLPDEIKHRKHKISNQVTSPENTLSFCKMEKETIEKTLHECSWNQSMASRLLGLTRNKLRYRIKKYQLTEPGIN
ncbi:MAG: sigma-54-dependent Fis family transcriptional regulator [Candidatus Brocadiaceae bacterium]|nr:sigma-54-dependent Fis family transcriptional regulator [Candidatus Brocadiaceae bacterium]